MTSVVVYDRSLQKIAYLENAFDVCYTQKLNDLSTAQFSLPIDDDKNKFCQPFNFVEIFDGDDRVDLFRILPTQLTKDGDTRSIKYQCEHVLSTLLDDVLYKYHQIGGVGIRTRDVLQYILDRQTVKHWQLGQVDFTRQFLYKWENENLLAAIFSVPKPFDEEYQWTWDTSSYPWTLSLIRPSTSVSTYVHYRKNLQGITKTTDPTMLCTRLYALGYGEGDNQLTIESVNPTGKAYIDADTQAQYGIISRIWVDRRYENAEALYNAAVAMLSKLKIPRISYDIDAADLYQLTRDSIDKFEIGALVRVVDDEIGVDYQTRVVGITKNNVTSNPADIKIELSNQTLNVASSIAELADRTRINEVYAQGATNLDSHNFADNCDAQHPAVIRFYIPADAVRINKVMLSYQVSAFRAYSRAIAGGGATQTTTSAGGHHSDTTASGGSVQATTSAGGHHADTTASGGGAQPSVPFGTRGWINFGRRVESFIVAASRHNHGITPGTRLMVDGGGTVTFRESGNHMHGMYDFGLFVDIPDHTHSFSVPNHSHSVNIPSHRHSFSVPSHSHNVSIPNHTHDIEYGIFLGGNATSITLRVDNTPVPNITALSGNDIDIIPYLSKDAGGRIIRGWHTIEITPNDLARVEANLVVQLFCQSRGRGDY